jgi:hypothetical protein
MMKKFVILVFCMFAAGSVCAEETIAQKAGEDAKKGAEATERGLKKGGEAAGRGLEKGEKATVKGIKKGGKWVGKGLDKAGQKLEKVFK